MLKDSFVAFDEFVPDTNVHYTSADFNTRLAQYDVMAIHALVDEISGSYSSATITVYIQHSGDGRLWVAKNDDPELDGVALSTSGQEGQAWGGDAGSLPTLAFARLAIQITGSGLSAGHIRVTVALRDTGS